MTQWHRFILVTALWTLAWSGMLLGTVLDEVRIMLWGMYVGTAGAVAMVWLILEHVAARVQTRVIADLTDRDRQRTQEMARALVLADETHLRAID